jgi:hypothetical protein
VARAAALDLDVIACDLAVALSFNHAFVANKLTAWHGSHEAALQAARRAGNRLGEATLLAGLGYIRFSLDHFDEAQDNAG